MRSAVCQGFEMSRREAVVAARVSSVASVSAVGQVAGGC